MHKLVGMKVMSAMILVIQLAIAIIALWPNSTMQYRSKLILDCTISPILTVTYIYWLCKVFKLMRDLRNDSL